MSMAMVMSMMVMLRRRHPREMSFIIKVHKDVSNSLQIVFSALLIFAVSIDTTISSCSCEHSCFLMLQVLTIFGVDVPFG